MTWLLESPWPALAGGIFAEVALVATFMSTGRVRMVGWMAVVAALTGGLLLIEWLVVTDREQISADVHAAAAAVEKGDVNGVLSFVSPSAIALQAKARLVTALGLREVRVADDMKIYIRGDVDPPQAQVTCTVIVVPGMGYQGKVPVNVTAFFRKQEGKWRVYKADSSMDNFFGS